MRRGMALVLVGALAAGCNPKPTMAVGGVTTVAGLLITQIPDDCEDNFFCFKNADVGAAIAITGLIIVGIGLIQYGAQESRPKPPVIRPGDTVMIGNVVVPPAPFPVGADPYAQPEEPVVQIESNLPPLPAAELTYADATQRQFAFQASSAARRGNCAAAVASGKRLGIELEQRLLAVDRAYATCVGN